MSHRVCGGQKTTLGVCPSFPPGLETGSLLCGFSAAHTRLFDLPASSDAPVSTSPLTVSSGIATTPSFTLFLRLPTRVLQLARQVFLLTPQKAFFGLRSHVAMMAGFEFSV